MAEPINLDELMDKPSAYETSEPTDSDNTGYDSAADDTAFEDTPNTDSQEDVDTGGVNDGYEGTEESVESFENQADAAADEGSNSVETTDEPAVTVSEYKFKDDFIKKAVEYYEKYGTLSPYLEETNTDYDAMDDIDILRKQFDKENADLSEKARTKLFERQLEKYNIDSYDEDDLEVGQALLKRDASKIRAELKEQREQFLSSIKPEESQESQISQEELEAKRVEARKAVESGISSVIKDNYIKVEANGDGINYQIPNKDIVIDYALDSAKFLSTFAKDGQIDWEKWTKVVAFAENPTLFTSELIKHGKSLGRKAMEAELKNVAPMNKSREAMPDPEFDHPHENPIEFLRAMKVKK
jgi:chaperonin cofactor prefoldin